MKQGISLKTFIFIFISLSLILIIVGFIYDTKEYTINILAEITGLFLGIIAAILLVDRFTENQRKKRWTRVRILSHRTIANHLSNILLELHNYFPQLNQPVNEPQLDRLIPQLQQAFLNHQITAESIREYFNSIKWDISQIRLDLMPRVMQSSDNQELIDALIEFDDVAQDLHKCVIIKKRIIEPDVYNNFMRLLEKIRDINQLL